MHQMKPLQKPLGNMARQRPMSQRFTTIWHQLALCCQPSWILIITDFINKTENLFINKTKIKICFSPQLLAGYHKINNVIISWFLSPYQKKSYEVLEEYWEYQTYWCVTTEDGRTNCAKLVINLLFFLQKKIFFLITAIWFWKENVFHILF